MVRAHWKIIRVQANILAVVVSALSIASIFMTHTLFTVVTNVQFEAPRLMKKEYSMLGDDWPPFAPLKLEKKVEMVVEESVHYVAGPGGNGNGNGNGKDEWEYQRGFGFDGAARLGAHNRTFAVSLYHQEHCLLYFHAQLTERTSTNLKPESDSDSDSDSSTTTRTMPVGGRSAHHQHCLNYLRQQALCHPDLTLEPGDFAAAKTMPRRDFEVDRVGETHVCRDFDAAWDYNTERWLEWYDFLKDGRITTTPSLESFD